MLRSQFFAIYSFSAKNWRFSFRDFTYSRQKIGDFLFAILPILDEKTAIFFSRFSFRDFLFAIVPILDEKTAIFFSRFSFRDFTYSG
jgi:hypothetical protein